MTWRITHFDRRGLRRRLDVHGTTRDLAIAYAEQLWGDARQLHAIRLCGVPV